MMKKILIGVAIVLIASLGVHAFYSYRPYNVILITIDTLRPEYLSCYKPEINTTPNIDRIAQHGVLFTNAYTLIPITMPAHTAILTSRSPARIRVFNNGDRFDNPTPLITQLLKPKGYSTAAFISLGVLNKGFGLASGFDLYDDNFDGTNGRFYKVASEVNADVLPWLEQHRKKRFFTWIHYSDPHEPYVTVDAPPDTEVLVNGESKLKVCLAKKEKILLQFSARPGPNVIELRALQSSERKPIAQSSRFLDPRVLITPAEGTALEYGNEWQTITLKNRSQVRYFQKNASLRLINREKTPKNLELRFTGGVWETNIREIRKNYAAEVRYTDRYIGELWNKLSVWGLLDKTIVIISADHGEGLKTHGILGHVDKLWDETTRIPFIIYYPGLGRQGQKEHRLVNLLDITPTVLDLLHIRYPKIMEGHSLKAVVSRSPVDWLLTKNVLRRWTFACTFAPEAARNVFSMTDGTLKLIHTPTKKTYEAYDLNADPLERKNLARWNPKRYESLSDLRELLDAHTQEMEYAHDNRANPALDEKEREMLHSLGYVANGDEE